jgi:hypothetical protein
MAFIRIASVGEKRYVQVAEYYYDPTGTRKLKIIKSFGLESSQTKIEAQTFLSNFENFEKLRKNNPNMGWDELLKIFLGIGGGVLAVYLGIEILKWIFDKDKK